MANFTPLTQDQYQRALNAGFSPQQILQNEQTRKQSMSSVPITPTKPKVPLVAQAFIGLTKSEQGFGRNIGQAAYAVGGGEKNIQNITQQYIDNGNKLLDLANKQTDPQMKLKYSQMSSDMFTQAGQVTGSVLGKVDTTEQVAGNALGVGLDLATAGGIGKAFTPATQAVGIIPGAIQGAKVGALAGGIYGTVRGLAQGMQANKTGGALLGSELGGTAAGAAGGAVIGGVTGGISGGIQAHQLQPEEQIKALKDTMPKVTAKVGRGAIENAGQPGGATAIGSFGQSEVQPTAKDVQRMQDVLPYFDKNPVKFAENIKTDMIPTISNNIQTTLEQNATPADLQDLTTRIQNIQVPKLLSSDQTALIDKAKNIAIDTINSNMTLSDGAVSHSLEDLAGKFDNATGVFANEYDPNLAVKIRDLQIPPGSTIQQMQQVINDGLTPQEQSIVAPHLAERTSELLHYARTPDEFSAFFDLTKPPTTDKLWQGDGGRIAFDQSVNAAKTGVVDPEKLKAINIAVSQIRNQWNDYIEETTLGGGKYSSDMATQFSDAMSKLHNAYDALDNLGSNYGSTVGKSAMQIFSSKYPTLGKLIKGSEIAGGIGVLGGGVYELYNLLRKK